MLDELFDMLSQSGAGSAKKGSPDSQDLIGGLLEGMLGGARTAPESQSPGGMGDLGGILSGILGGMGPTSPGAGGQAGIGANPMLMPFTEALAEKLNISPQMAAVIISAAFTLLMSAISKSQTPESGAAGQGLDLDQLLDKDFIASSGAAQQVAQQTGMDDDQAAESLQEALKMLSGVAEPESEKIPQKPAVQKSSSLESLLDNWDTD